MEAYLHEHALRMNLYIYKCICICIYICICVCVCVYRKYIRNIVSLYIYNIKTEPVSFGSFVHSYVLVEICLFIYFVCAM